MIRGNEIHNVLIVVTRYFGGTLLGTGGLVRAYTQAAQEGIAASTIVTKTQGYKVKIQTDYTTLGKIQYLLGQKGSDYRLGISRKCRDFCLHIKRGGNCTST